MKVLGGIVPTLGVLFLLNSSATYFLAGKIHEPGAWGNFGAILAVGIIVIAIGLSMFRGKRSDDGPSSGA